MLGGLRAVHEATDLPIVVQDYPAISGVTVPADVLAGALADVAELEQAPEEVQLGGAEVLTYREMMARSAAVLGRRRPPSPPRRSSRDPVKPRLATVTRWRGTR